MKCSHCNHNLPDDCDFCIYCGTKIENTTEVISTADKTQPTIKISEEHQDTQDEIKNLNELKKQIKEKQKEQKTLCVLLKSKSAHNGRPQERLRKKVV